jgi:hypothetical protein
MKAPARKAVERLSPNQCCHLSSAGRRCRSARCTPTSSLCTRHRDMEQNARSADLSPDLAARLTDIRKSLQSVEGVRDSLAELYVLLAQNRVSARRAAVLANISSLLLRLLPDEDDSETRKPEIKFIFGRAPSPEVEAAGPITDESQLTEDCPGAFYALRTTYGPPLKKDAADDERAAIENYQAIST